MIRPALASLMPRRKCASADCDIRQTPDFASEGMNLACGEEWIQHDAGGDMKGWKRTSVGTRALIGVLALALGGVAYAPSSRAAEAGAIPADLTGKLAGLGDPRLPFLRSGKAKRVVHSGLNLGS